MWEFINFLLIITILIIILVSIIIIFMLYFHIKNYVTETIEQVGSMIPMLEQYEYKNISFFYYKQVSPKWVFVF